MAGQSSAMFAWSWTEMGVLGSQVFGQAFMESCAYWPSSFKVKVEICARERKGEEVDTNLGFF